MKRPKVVPASSQFLVGIVVLPFMAACSGQIQDKAAAGTADGSDDNGEGEPQKAEACGTTPAASPARWRRLTASQYANTVSDLLGQRPSTLGLVADSRTGAFRTNALIPVQEADIGAYATMAETISTKAVANMASLRLGCEPKTADDEDACAAKFIDDFGTRAYRRPLKDEERAAFKAVFEAGRGDGFAEGIRLVIESALQSPNLLYMVEAGQEEGGDVFRLTGYEVGTRLAYLITGSTPSAEALQAAKDGKLDTAKGVRDYATQLMSSPAFTAQVAAFYTELVGADELTSDGNGITKTSGKYPGFNATLRKAMADEANKFVSYVMNTGSGSVEEILSADYVFPEGLSAVYGNQVKAGADGRALIGDGTRRGLLTLPAVQATHPKLPTPRGAVNRGHMVRRDLLCEVVPPVTDMVDFTLPPNAAQMTAQQLLKAHQENPTCKGCHQLMDSIGFGFESYDEIGAYRTKDSAGNAIDPSGEIVGIAGDTTFMNAAEMANILAHSPQVRSCMGTQWFRFALGRDPDDADACTQQTLAAAFAEGKGNIKDALLKFVSSDSFRFNGGL